MSGKCWICNNKTEIKSVKLRDGTEENINVCSNCGFEFFDKENLTLIENNKFEDARLASAGLEIPEIETDFQNGYKQSEEYITKYIDRNSTDCKVLEIGCSWGYLLKQLSELNIECVGLEKNPVRAEYVNNKLGIECVQDLSEIESGKHIFDKIFMFYVLEYITGPLNYLKRLIGLLKSGGCIIIYTPNRLDTLKDVWCNEGFQNFFYEKQAVSYYTTKSIKILMEKIEDKNISYDLTTNQGYSFFNHLSWYFSDKPRTTGMVGADNYAKEINTNINGSLQLGKELKIFIDEVDKKYKNIIEENNYGNQIILTINKGLQ